MIFDCNAYLGHYPFRRLRHANPKGMIEQMDRYNIQRSIVSSLPAIFYRDCHRGNEALFEETRPWKDRFVLASTVNPRYVDWERDLDIAIDRWQMKLATIVPSHHGYSLQDDFGSSVLKAIEERNLPLLLTQRFEDRRQRHSWDQAEDLELKSVLGIAERFPKLRIVLSNWIGLDGSKLQDAGMKGRCLIDFSRLHVVLHKDVPKLIETMGIESIVFGSHLPFDYVGPSLVKLSNLQSLPKEDFEKIAWRNAVSFLNLQ